MLRFHVLIFEPLKIAYIRTRQRVAGGYKGFP